MFFTTKTNGEFVPKGYHHLTYEQRCHISILKARGDLPSRIAKDIGVGHSTINRELKRNQGSEGYDYQQAQEKTNQRRNRQPNKKLTPQLIAIIENGLRCQWSPVQISGRLKKEHAEHVSHETIYCYIWEDKKKGGLLYKELRHRGKKYNKRSKGTAGRGCIPGRVDITQRPTIVEAKTRLGDLEIDTIIGANHDGVIVSIVDRATKFTKLVKVPNKTAAEVGRALIEQLMPYKDFIHTLTADNGKEFAYHQMVSSALDADFYFATPYHSWERGLNEHTNGLVRQYFPKTQSLSSVSAEDIVRIETLLNNRPRKVLGFATPQEVFDRMSRAVG